MVCVQVWLKVYEWFFCLIFWLTRDAIWYVTVLSLGTNLCVLGWTNLFFYVLMTRNAIWVCDSNLSLGTTMCFGWTNFLLRRSCPGFVYLGFQNRNETIVKLT